MNQDEQVKEILLTLANIRKRHVHMISELDDFGPAEMHVSHVLWENERIYEKHLMAKDIAKLTKMSKPVLSRVMRNLEQKELIERIVPEHDHRVVQFQMSQKGKEILQKGAKKMHENTIEIINIMGPENVCKLIEGMHALEEALDYLKKKGE